MNLTLNRMTSSPHRPVGNRCAITSFGAKKRDPLEGEPLGFQIAAGALASYLEDSAVILGLPKGTILGPETVLRHLREVQDQIIGYDQESMETRLMQLFYPDYKDEDN